MLLIVRMVLLVVHEPVKGIKSLPALREEAHIFVAGDFILKDILLNRFGQSLVLKAFFPI